MEYEINFHLKNITYHKDLSLYMRNKLKLKYTY